jgi:hypothetical protein
MCFPSPGHKKSTMPSQAPDPIPRFLQNDPLQFCQGSGWEPEWEMCCPSPGHKKSTMSSQAPDPTPNFSKMVLCSSVRVQVGNLSGKYASRPRAIINQQCPVRLLTYPQLFQNGPLQFCQDSSWEPECKMCFPSPGHKKSTMSSQAPDPTPNFSKMVFCSSVRFQAGNLSGKCASFPRAIKNQQCPLRLLTLPPTFPKWSFAVLFGFRLGPECKCASLPRAIKNQQCPVRLLTLPRTFPKLSFAFLLGFRLGA